MKIYKHEAGGHWVGSCMVVVADNYNEAETHIKRLLVKNGLPDEELNIKEIEIFSGCKVVEINGDY